MGTSPDPGNPDKFSADLRQVPTKPVAPVIPRRLVKANIVRLVSSDGASGTGIALVPGRTARKTSVTMSQRS